MPIGSPEDNFGYLNANMNQKLSMRSDSIVPSAGREGTSIVPQIYRGRTMAVFTSGGDASGNIFSNTRDQTVKKMFYELNVFGNSSYPLFLF